MDTLSPQERSERMGRVLSKHTMPELIVRSVTYGLGYRYRLHARNLPGKPDLVFPSRRKAIFVHGCFWHRHEGCPLARLPKSKLEFWVPKLEGNRKRDLQKQAALREAGWEFITIWECQLRNRNRIASVVREFLSPSGSC